MTAQQRLSSARVDAGARAGLGVNRLAISRTTPYSCSRRPRARNPGASAGTRGGRVCSRAMKLVRDEFEKLALEHIDMLYRIARRLTRDANRAEDLVQETYLRALRAGDEFELQAYG